MRTVGPILLGALALMLAAVGSAQAQKSNAPGASQAGRSLSLEGNAQDSVSQSHTLFQIGGVGVHLWSPVEPPYDSHANRNFAADPLWEAGMGTSQSSGW
jgi:hypothetical protein